MLDQSDFQLDQLDTVAGTPVQAAAVAGTPNLRMLVWSPAWHKSINRETRWWQDVLFGFQSDLLAALAPVRLLVCVTVKEAALGWSESSTDLFLPDGLVAVDGEEWRK